MSTAFASNAFSPNAFAPIAFALGAANYAVISAEDPSLKGVLLRGDIARSVAMADLAAKGVCLTDELAASVNVYRLNNAVGFEGIKEASAVLNGEVCRAVCVNDELNQTVRMDG